MEGSGKITTKNRIPVFLNISMRYLFITTVLNGNETWVSAGPLKAPAIIVFA
jgi:hypothetical protein